ncbi:deoxyhypusine synthase [[Eubacterium] cellulosolvens]
MPYVKQMKIRRRMRIADIAFEMSKSGVLGAGKFAQAVDITKNIFFKKYTCFLSLAGPMVAGGLRQIIRDLIDDDYVNVIISTGANVTHDLIEALGYRHKIGTSKANDIKLKKSGIGRIYDINIGMEAFEGLEKWVYQILNELNNETKKNLAGYELLWEFGRKLKDNNSILKTCYKKKVPIICPGIQDSMLGMNLWTYSTFNKLMINSLKDLSKLTEISFESKRIGAIIIGGGLPKHHLLMANTIRGGVDAAIQITMDRPEAGGLSGAPLEEAISWRKIRNERKVSNLVGDATILFPLIVAAALD